MTRLMTLLSVILLSPTLLLAGQNSKAKTLVFTHITVIDVAAGTTKAGMTLVIAGDRIAKVGRTGEVQIPADAHIIDAAGKWALPGLIDMHTHGATQSDLPLGLYVVNGVTSIRDVGGDITQLRLTRQQLEAGQRIGPRLFFAGQILDGNPPLWPPLSIIADTPARAESAVNFLSDQGADLIKVYNGITEPVLEAVIRAAHRRSIPVTGHVPRSMTMTRAVEMGMGGLEHVRVTGRELLPPEEAEKIDFLPYAQREALLWERFDLASRGIRSLVSLLAERKVFLDPTLIADKATVVIPREEEINDPHNRFLPRALYNEWSREPLPEVYKVPPQLKEVAVAGFPKRKQFVGMCARSGVRIVAGTDGAGLGKLLPGFGLHHELELLVESGLKPFQALQAATVNAACALGKEREIGTVEAGKAADLIILDADPLVNIKNTSRINAVVINGRLLDRAALDKMFADMEAATDKK